MSFAPLRPGERKDFPSTIESLQKAAGAMLVNLMVLLSSIPSQPFHYELTRYRVDPTHRSQLIEVLQKKSQIIVAAGDPSPIIIEFGAAANWNVVVITPIGSIAGFFSDERVARWEAAAKRQGIDPAWLKSTLDRLVMTKEEGYLEGPDVTTFETASATHRTVEFELFRAKAGFQDSLAPERERINRFWDRIGRPQSHLFRKVAGAQWDLACLTFYKDTLQLRARSDLKSAEIDAAARASGFGGPKDVNPMLTRMIGELQRTIGRVVTRRMSSTSP